MSQIYKIQSKFGFCLVGQALGIKLGLWRPPKAGSVWQTKHAIADSWKANRQSYDDKAHSIPLLFRMLWE